MTNNFTPLHKQILPLGKILKDLWKNFWHLRTIFLLIIILLLLNSFVFYLVEAKHIESKETQIQKASDIIFITLNNTLPINITNYIPKTRLGKVILILDSLCGFMLLGLVIWIIQVSIKDQIIKESKCLFFATDKNAKIKH